MSANENVITEDVVILAKPELMPLLVEAHRCPDCNSNVSSRFDSKDQRTHIHVRHDDTCPTWQSMLNRKQRRATRHRKGKGF